MISTSSLLIFIAFGIKCAFPLLHNWLQDSYPKATVTGTVFLSTFSTKLAIYTLARGFVGTEELITIGCIMTLFPIIFAVIENDLRRVLGLQSQQPIGFHGRGNWDRIRTGTQWDGRSCVLSHHLQITAFSCRWEQFCIAWEPPKPQS